MAVFTGRKRIIVAVIGVAAATALMFAPGVLRRMKGSTPKAGEQQNLPPGNHPAASQNIELSQACDALASSAPADVVKHWVAAYRATRNALEREVWIRDRFAWMELHKVETTLATCGIRSTQALTIIAAIAKDEDYGRFVREERDAICAFGQKLATATSGATAWREDSSVLWNATCVRLLSGPVAGGSTSSVPREAVPSVSAAPPTEACTGLDALSAARAEMVSRSLSADAWIAYGRTLASCGPDTSPWEALHLAGGREQFMDEYVASFINGDVASGSPFQKQAADLYDRILLSWGLEE